MAERKREEVLAEIKEKATALVKDYKDYLELSKYKYYQNGKIWTDEDQMVEDIWFELFDDAVSDACTDILEMYEPDEGEDDYGTW